MKIEELTASPSKLMRRFKDKTLSFISHEKNKVTPYTERGLEHLVLWVLPGKNWTIIWMFCILLIGSPWIEIFVVLIKLTRNVRRGHEESPFLECTQTTQKTYRFDMPQEQVLFVADHTMRQKQYLEVLKVIFLPCISKNRENRIWYIFKQHGASCNTVKTGKNVLQSPDFLF